ncbi:hypothetical protein C8J57DRAFT_1224834 [Mycena rebaudengoi]|nr:hypothetical protein C8J57DRAFT_1224834 [Mycena rebaudengoi]
MANKYISRCLKLLAIFFAATKDATVGSSKTRLLPAQAFWRQKPLKKKAEKRFKMWLCSKLRICEGKIERGTRGRLWWQRVGELKFVWIRSQAKQITRAVNSEAVLGKNHGDPMKSRISGETWELPRGSLWVLRLSRLQAPYIVLAIMARVGGFAQYDMALLIEVPE